METRRAPPRVALLGAQIEAVPEALLREAPPAMLEAGGW